MWPENTQNIHYSIWGYVFFLHLNLSSLERLLARAFFHAAYQTLHFLKHFTFFLHYGRLFKLWKPSYDEQQQQQQQQPQQQC